MKSFVLISFMLFILYCGAIAQDSSCGIVWEQPIQLSPDKVINYAPSIAIQGDTINITWWSSGLPFPYARSLDGGKTFEPLRFLAPDSTQLVNQCHIISAGKRLHGFFHSNENAQTYHTYSDDRGTTWSTPNRILDSIGLTNSEMYTALGDTIILYNVWIHHGNGFTVSTDGGISWTFRLQMIPHQPGDGLSIGLTLGTLHLVKAWVFDSAGVSSEFAIQYRKSTDLGITWTDSIPLSTINVEHSEAGELSLSVDNNGDSSTIFTAWKDGKNGCLTLVGCSVLGKFSKDNGNSFMYEQRYDERPAGFLTRTAIWDKTMAITWVDDLPEGGGLKIRMSYDGGVSWCPQYTLSPGGIADVAISSKAIHIVWDEGIFDSVWRYNIIYRRGVFLPTGIRQAIEEIPNKFSLDQNYPNPLNPKTIIQYSVPIQSNLTIRVYDVLGREITTLVNERKQAGNYTVEWNTENLPSGVYMYRMIAGTYTLTKKALILK